jgi:hypothetical protein
MAAERGARRLRFNHAQPTSFLVDDFRNKRLAAATAGSGAAVLGDVPAIDGAAVHAGANFSVGNPAAVADNHEGKAELSGLKRGRAP